MAENIRTSQQLLDEAVAKGGIVAVFYFDISVNEKNAVQPALAELVQKLSVEPGIVSCVAEINEPIEIGDLWTSSAEVTLLGKTFSHIAAAAIRYGPMGVEVLRPHEIKLSMGEAQSLLLNIAGVGQEFTTYIMKKIMTEEEKEKFEKKLAARLEMGKRLLEKKEGEKKG